MERYLCIHAHFYQPPRENPWLEAIEVQDSAYPYHDWNERVTAECYAPNHASRILDEEGRIKEVVSNYAQMSLILGLPSFPGWRNIPPRSIRLYWRRIKRAGIRGPGMGPPWPSAITI